MLKSLIDRLFGESIGRRLRASDPIRWEAELLERVKEMTPRDPKSGAKVGGKELADRLLETINMGRGIHVESLMCAAGALAGYSCQAAIRAKNIGDGLDEITGLTVTEAIDGNLYFFGDRLNTLLAEDESSVLNIAARAAQAYGCKGIPDISEIFMHVAKSVGTNTFGIPRLPEGHPVQALPRTYLEWLWPKFSPAVERFCPNPDQWPLLFGLLLQNLLLHTKDVLAPRIALQVIMESAIPMSKVKLNGVDST
jgi:hypothetical protein